MKTIVIKSQDELNALPTKFEEYTEIEIRSHKGTWIDVRKKYDNAMVRACDSSTVRARDSSTVRAYDSSTVRAYDSSTVRAYDSSTVTARDSSTVTAYGSSTVTAYDSSTVTAYGSSVILVLSAMVVMQKIVNQAVVILQNVKPKMPPRRGKFTHVVKRGKYKHTNKTFAHRCDSDSADHVILYKSVHPETCCDFRTGKIKYDGVVEAPDFDPSPDRECGGGLHLSPTPELALSYNDGKLLKCRVHLDDFVVFQGNLTKVRCRRVEVLGEIAQGAGV